MGTFAAPEDVTNVMDAGNAVGIYDERTPQALVSIPGVEWSVGAAAPPPVLADRLVAVRRAFNNVGLYDEKADQMLGKTVGGSLNGAITVPNVVGTLLAAARVALAAAGCRVGTVSEVASAEPETEVVTQSVAPGASTVYVVVNLEVSDESL